MFEEETLGAFFFINNFDNFKIIIKEIFDNYINDKRCLFSLIVTGKT